MPTLTVTPSQAHRLAQEFARYHATLELLTLGTPFAGAALADINTDTGVLTFHVAPSDAPAVNDG